MTLTWHRDEKVEKKKKSLSYSNFKMTNKNITPTSAFAGLSNTNAGGDRSTTDNTGHMSRIYHNNNQYTTPIYMYIRQYCTLDFIIIYGRMILIGLPTSVHI